MNVPDAAQVRRAASAAVRAAPWAATAAVGLVPALAADVAWARPVAITAFFVAVVLRTSTAALSRPTGRGLGLTMAAALALFGTGSLVLALGPGQGFPSVAEVFFGSAYLCFTGFLILDVTGRHEWTMRAVLETGVIGGGIISGAMFALVVPLSVALPGGGLPLIVSLVYPVADVVLITILLTQLLTRHRDWDRRSALLLAGLVALAAVDVSLPLGLGSAGYAFSGAQDLVWAASLAILAEAASRPLRSPAVGVRAGMGPGAASVAGLCALAVLAVNGGPASDWLTHPPAVATMVLSLGLLLTSLREARSANEAQRLSRTDDLTGLGNRRALSQRLASASERPMTLLLIDLNGFKAVNDTFGHPEGDRLLGHVGRRLADVAPSADLVARLGGDEFAILLDGVPAEAAAELAEALVTAMAEPLQIADIGLTVSLAIGLATSQPARLDGTELMRRADVAMYRAKTSVSGWQWYDPATDDFTRERLLLVEDLRNGIDADQLRAVYQPQVRASDGALVAVEALVRWQHPKLGLLAPAAFLPQARAAGLMLPLSIAMIRICVGQAAAWAATGSPIRLSLNVDPPELLSGIWVPTLTAEIDRHGIDPGLITVELTEELLVGDPARAAAIVHELARHGVDVSIDDYGTGYSGLTWLQTLPVAELKLARVFVGRVLSDERTRHIVQSTIHLADQLGLRVVAEGVEDADTAAALAEMGAHLLQGYLVSRPLLAPALWTWRTCHASAAAPPGLVGRAR